jgi:hypothetical protein
MDYSVKRNELSTLKLIWVILLGRVRNIRLKIILVDTVPDNLQQSYLENENEVRRLTSLPEVPIDNLAARENRYCIIYSKNRVIGSVLCYNCSRICFLNFLFVIPSYRGRNIGKLLTAIIIKDQIKSPSKIDKFITDPTMEIARKILRELNFKPDYVLY